MDKDQTEQLIELVRNRPALYDKRIKGYADRITNKALWEEICEELIHTWNALSSEEKTIKAREIHQRWQNLRTCFKREINRSKSGKWPKTHRKYIYFNQLRFLLLTIEDTEPATKTIPPRFYENKTKHTNAPAPAEKPKNDTGPSHKKSVELEEIDEDKCFLLSLVPSLRRMTEDQKIEAKMEFLSVIRRINQSQPTQVHEEIRDIKQEVRESSHFLGETSHQVVSSTPGYSDSSQCSFMSSNYSAPSDFIEITNIKME